MKDHLREGVHVSKQVKIVKSKVLSHEQVKLAGSRFEIRIVRYRPNMDYIGLCSINHLIIYVSAIPYGLTTLPHEISHALAVLLYGEYDPKLTAEQLACFGSVVACTMKQNDVKRCTAKLKRLATLAKQDSGIVD